MYGADPTISARLGLTRQWLHAVQLGFRIRRRGEPVLFDSEYRPTCNTRSTYCAPISLSRASRLSESFGSLKNGVSPRD